MDAVAAIAPTAAILEGYRRAISRYRSPTAGPQNGFLTLTDIVESASEHAQGLVPRLPGVGLRLDRKV